MDNKITYYYLKLLLDVDKSDSDFSQAWRECIDNVEFSSDPHTPFSLIEELAYLAFKTGFECGLNENQSTDF